MFRINLLSYLKQIFQEVKFCSVFWGFWLDFVFALSRDRKWNIYIGMLLIFLILICDFQLICSRRRCQLHSFGNFVDLKQ